MRYGARRDMVGARAGHAKRPERPLVSLLMPCFQQEAYVGAAVRSALAQDYDPLEILISDDASTDGTYAALEREVAAAGTRHTVKLNRNPVNLGIENYNVLAGMARGTLLVEGHGDDVSLPDRVSALVEAWRASGASLVSSNAIVIDGEDTEQGIYFEPDEEHGLDALALARRGWNRWLLGATFAYHREVCARFPPFERARSAIAIDWLLPFRAALLDGIELVRRPLLKHRVHGANATTVALGRGDPEPGVRREADHAHRIIQFSYMLDTLRAFGPRGWRRPRRLRALEAALQTSIEDQVRRWARARNHLRSQGLRLRWTRGDPY
jgi:glycosyltransferase involved in cell wall biosynthesis